MTEAQYARMLAIGYLASARSASREALALLESIEDERGNALAKAVAVLGNIERSLSRQTAQEVNE